MNNQQDSAIRNQIIEYIRMYNNGGEAIGAEKIIRLFDGIAGNCPACGGSGTISQQIASVPNECVAATAKELKLKGYTVRAIASILGFRHPGSISHLLKK